MLKIISTVLMTTLLKSFCPAGCAEITYSPPQGFVLEESISDQNGLTFLGNDGVISIDNTDGIETIDQAKLVMAASLLAMKESLPNFTMIHDDVININDVYFILFIYSYLSSDGEHVVVYSYHCVFNGCMINSLLTVLENQAMSHKDSFHDSIAAMSFRYP